MVRYAIFSTMGVLAGLLLDLLFGDPEVSWHPIRRIGALIAATETVLRARLQNGTAGAHPAVAELQAGRFLAAVVCAAGTLPASALLLALWRICPPAYVVLEALLSWFLLATKSLKTESMNVYAALNRDGLSAGRTAVSRIVGRDTENLSEEGVLKAAVETVAENASDGVVAPLFYMMLGGAGLGLLYKCINTMDSMVGYKNEKYLYFGRCAAKLDDAANFIPSRLTAHFMIAGSALLGYPAKRSAAIYRRDRRKHASPNAAQTESVMAGALGVRLAGNAYYFGKLYEKESIGDAVRGIEREDIRRANRILYATLAVAAVCFLLVKGCIIVCMNMAATYTAI